MYQVALKVEARAKELCTSATVRPTIRSGVNQHGAWVGSDHELALWLENGTGVYGPHHSPIVPTSSTVLVFPSRRGGKGFVFAKSVRGQKAKPFLEPALQALHE